VAWTPCASRQVLDQKAFLLCPISRGDDASKNHPGYTGNGGRENRSLKRGRSPGMAGGGPAAAAVVMAVAVASISELVAVTAVPISAVAAVAAAAIPLAVRRRWNAAGLD